MPSFPEELFEVEITGDFIKVTHPQENDASINWQDITEINVRTTDQGPLLPDVWLELLGKDSYCRIPQGNSSYITIYDRISEWPGFDFENYILAMSSTENTVFRLWAAGE